jgi:hypothetical protein
VSAKAAAQARLVAAFREGFGLAALAVVEGRDGVRVVAAEPGDDIAIAATERLHGRWRCRPPSEAAAIATAVTACRKRDAADDAALLACRAVVRAAKQRHVELLSEDDVAAQAAAVIARVEDELEQLRRCGDLRPVNRSYQAYRQDAAARGERVVPYAQWMLGYKAGLVRKLAATLRFL